LSVSVPTSRPCPPNRRQHRHLLGRVRESRVQTRLLGCVRSENLAVALHLRMQPPPQQHLSGPVAVGAVKGRVLPRRMPECVKSAGRVGRESSRATTTSSAHPPSWYRMIPAKSASRFFTAALGVPGKKPPSSSSPPAGTPVSISKASSMVSMGQTWKWPS
jgi:hypothetical protein